MTQAPNETVETDYIGSAQAAHMLRITRRTLYRWQDRGYLTPATTPSGQYRYLRSEVEALLARDGAA